MNTSRFLVALGVVLCLVLLSVMVLVPANTAQAQPGDGSWPMFHQNLTRTGSANLSSATPVPYLGVHLLWEWQTSDSICSSPMTADLNGDGGIETVVGGQDRVYCLSNTGNLLWSFLTGSSDNFATIADIYEDGQPEVIVSPNDGYLYCLDGVDGHLIWISDLMSGNSDWNNAPTIADIDDDGEVEIIAIAGTANCFDRNGHKIWTWHYGGGGFDSVPAVTDLNNDGKLEIVFNHQANSLVCLNSTGSVIWQSLITGCGGPRSYVPALSDINDDGMFEVITTLIDSPAPCPASLHVFSSQGALIWKSAPWNLTGEESSICPAVCDVNQDGHLDIVLGSQAGNVLCFDATGGEIWRSGAVTTTGTMPSAPVVADLTGDGVPEIILGPDEGTIYCLNHFGGLLWTFDGGLDPTVLTCGGHQRSPVIADVNEDGILDIIFASRNAVYALSAGSGTTVGWET